jgi:DNA topoisomerase-1
LKVYFESNDDEEDKQSSDIILPPIKVNDKLNCASINASQRFTQKPPRYTEASLVKKLEEQGIGRPSIMHPLSQPFKTVGMSLKKTGKGTSVIFITLTLKGNNIKEQTKTEITDSKNRSFFLPILALW